MGEPDMRVGPPFGAVGWRTATIVVHTVEGVAAVMEGRLPAGLPYLRLGQGPPLVMALGGVAEHANPVGAGRRVSLATAARFAEHFTAYVTSRKPGLAPGTTMAGIAADYAAAIGEEFGGPVAFHGTSAGGAIGLQLAIGYPQLVRRLVLAAAACRLSPSGCHMLAEVAGLATAGDSRRASALVAQALVPRLVRHPAGALAWLVNPFVAGNPADMLTTNAAMLAFDAEPGLCQVQAPALVLGGTADPYYSEDLFRRTAAAIPGGQAVIFPGKGHLYPRSFQGRSQHRAGVPARMVAKVNAPSRGRRAHRRERSWVGFPDRWAW